MPNNSRNGIGLLLLVFGFIIMFFGLLFIIYELDMSYVVGPGDLVVPLSRGTQSFGIILFLIGAVLLIIGAFLWLRMRPKTDKQKI